MLESLFNKVYQKETETQKFSSEYCEIFKNSSFYCGTLVASSEDWQQHLNKKRLKSFS